MLRISSQPDRKALNVCTGASRATSETRLPTIENGRAEIRFIDAMTRDLEKTIPRVREKILALLETGDHR